MAALVLAACGSGEVGETDYDPDDPDAPVIAEKAFPQHVVADDDLGTFSMLVEDTYQAFDIQKIEGHYVVEGDILLPGSPAEVARRDDTGDRQAAAAVVPKYQRWPGGVMPYVVSRHLTSRQRWQILYAMVQWTRKAGVRFVKRSSQRDYVYFARSSGCSSYVGRIGGRQSIWLSTRCSTGSVMHEIGHALGLYHEQSRTDRGKYIRVLWKNIARGYSSNFKTYRARGLRAANWYKYDLSSIMHYGSTYFSKNGRPTIVTRGGKLIRPNRGGLSARDAAAVRRMYGR